MFEHTSTPLPGSGTCVYVRSDEMGWEEIEEERRGVVGDNRLGAGDTGDTQVRRFDDEEK